MGNFQWLSYGITHGYIPTSNCNDCPHYAVDIGTPFHTSVTALFSGLVLSQKTGLRWGTELFIKPDDMSVPEFYYYHLDILNTQPGQHVNAGDVIGLSGGQNAGGSNPTTPEYSSGPHTHVGLFTEYVMTANGQRPYGPDITPYIQALASGQLAPGGTTPLSNGGLTQLGENIVNILGINQGVIGALAGISQQPFQIVGIAALGIAAALLLVAWLLFNGGL